ncbi:pentapeptide repeat-containing protein [Schlegelella sp. S2-27]|uniref:Pentapeptide repeat-containing protein n=1 Tax=Caldimonas mangrovi TaxID=2944811 RepID=A0ABT0YPA6_9BURK|nr:pentapeptide repeat-containing protein [Caldimonas mangrovi]MCM5680562.1 pentapeptide repeat-containing protein [Caldimonas mangrovi]
MGPESVSAYPLIFAKLGYTTLCLPCRRHSERRCLPPAIPSAVVNPSEIHKRWDSDEQFAVVLHSILQHRPGEEWYADAPKVSHPWEGVEACDCRGLNLQRGQFGEISFSGCDLSSSTFRGSNFTGTYFQGAILSECNFSEARFEKTQMIPLYAKGANFEKTTFVAISANQSDISSSSFKSAALQELFLTGSMLPRNDFSGITAEYSKFNVCLLESSNFRDAKIVNTSFSGAQLVHCIFADATLENCDMRGSDCRGVDFSNARLIGGQFGRIARALGMAATKFDDTPAVRKMVAMSGAEGLDQIEWCAVTDSLDTRRQATGDPCP